MHHKNKEPRVLRLYRTNKNKFVCVFEKKAIFTSSRFRKHPDKQQGQSVALGPNPASIEEKRTQTQKQQKGPK